MTELEEGWGAPAAAGPVKESVAPWEDPELSVLAGLGRTLREILFRPGAFFANLGRGGGWAGPLAFGLIVSSVGLLGTFFWHLLVLAPAGRSPLPGLEPGLLMALMAGAPVLALVNLGVGGLCWWGSVALAGADRDFTPAWRIFCYAQGGMALGLIPFFGLVVAGVWVLVLLYCGLRQVYGISTGGALGALAIYLSLQAALALTLLLGLAATLAFLGFLLLLLG
jgi:hypothetical protein